MHAPWGVACTPLGAYRARPLGCTMHAPWGVPCTPLGAYRAHPLGCTVHAPWSVQRVSNGRLAGRAPPLKEACTPHMPKKRGVRGVWPIKTLFWFSVYAHSIIVEFEYVLCCTAIHQSTNINFTMVYRCVAGCKGCPEKRLKWDALFANPNNPLLERLVPVKNCTYGVSLMTNSSDFEIPITCCTNCN